jgi:hypothetical protein
MDVPLDGEERPWTKHLMGFRLEGCKAQVSAPVEVFDPAGPSSQVHAMSLGVGTRLGATREHLSHLSRYCYTVRLKTASQSST